MWTYVQSTGELVDASGEVVGRGYAGGGLDKENEEAAAGKNNPEMQNVPFVGPLPEGNYGFEAPVDSRVVGRYALRLDPDAANEMYGRDGFFMHGDSIVDPGWASDGCIVMPETVRVAVWESGDRRLQVVAKIA